jgi:hypothetical protein
MPLLAKFQSRLTTNLPQFPGSVVRTMARWQRIPNKVNTLAHLLKVSNKSSFPPPACTESAEDPIEYSVTAPVGHT